MFSFKEIKNLTNYISRGISPKYGDSGYIVINQRCIRKNLIKFYNSRFSVSEKKFNKNKILEQWDVLVNSTGIGTLGRVAQFKNKNISKKITVDSHVTIVRPNLNKIYGPYFGYAFIYVEDLIKTLGKGTTGQTELSREDLYKIKIPVPGLPQQKKISSILANYDVLIENNYKNIKILEKLLHHIYSEWFINFNFPNNQNSNKFNSEIDKIPSNWDYKSILDNPFFSLISENIRPYEGFKKYYATSDINKIDIIGKGIEYKYKDKPSRAQKIPKINSCWFARMQNTYKILAFTDINSERLSNEMLSSGFAGLQAKERIFFPYLFCTINSNQFHIKKDALCSGSTQRAINNKSLKFLKVISPTEELVKLFGNKTISLIEEIILLQKKNTLLIKTREILLSKFLSNLIDISEVKINSGIEVA